MYTKIIQGWVEQTYDNNGKCIEQSFVAAGEVDRRDANDEPIDDPELVAKIEDLEKHCPTDMVQPTNESICLDIHAPEV